MANFSPAPTPPPDRYGRRDRPRRAWMIVAAVLGTVFVALISWLGYRNTFPPITADLTGYQVVDARSVQVTFTVRKQKSRPARCLVRALDRDQTAVGSTVVAIPAGVDQRQLTVTVPTRRLAAAGEVTSCTLVPAAGASAPGGGTQPVG